MDIHRKPAGDTISDGQVELFAQDDVIIASVKFGTVLQIEPKEDLKKRTGKSPDFSEARMVSFG